MGMMETKVVQVENTPESINQAGELWGCFGWNVTSVQVTHSQNTKTVTEGLGWYTGTNTVKTTTINYATITLQRDRDIPYHDKLAAYQAEFETIMDTLEVEAVPGKSNLTSLFICVFLGVVGLALCLEHPYVGISMIVCALFAPSIVRGFNESAEKKARKEIRRRNNERKTRANELLEKAESLLNA